MNTTATFRIADGVTWDRSDDQVVILNSDGSQMITLNDVGSTLWPELEQPAGIESLVAALQARFGDVDPATLRNDVVAFVEELEAEGLIAAASP